MFRIAVFFAVLAVCSAHAVLPLVHGPVLAPATAVVAPVGPYLHGYAGHGLLGYGGHGLLGHGYIKPAGHHILKRSPHYVAPVGHLGAVGHLGGLGHLAPVAHVAPVAAVAPVAVSHQSRVDVRHTPAVVAAPIVPIVKPVVAPFLHAGSLTYGAGLHGSGHYGLGHYGAAYPHLGHY